MDDHRTEAACLLEPGALYRRRIGLEPAIGDGPLVFAGFKQGAFSLYFGDAPIYHFDLEGRWQRAFVDGLHYLKGLDADIHAIDRVREGPNLVLQSAEAELRRGQPTSTPDPIGRPGAAWPGSRDGRFRRRGTAGGKAQPLGNDELHDFLGTDRSLGYRRLVRPPRAVHRRLRPPALPASRMPECGRPPGDARPCRGAYVRAGCRCRARMCGRRGIRPARPRGGRLVGPAAAPEPRSYSSPATTSCTSRSRQVEAYLDAIDADVSDSGEGAMTATTGCPIRGRPRLPRRFHGRYLDPERLAPARRAGLEPGQSGSRVGRPGSPGLYGKTWDDDELGRPSPTSRRLGSGSAS